MSSLVERLKGMDHAKSEENQSQSVEKEPTAHELAQAKGIRCFTKLRLHRLILSNGQEVKPTVEGVYIAVTPEIEKLLEFYAKNHWGSVEELITEKK